MAHQWEFIEDETGRWRWRSNRSDGSQCVSDETFRSGIDCVVNAMRNGYLSGTSLPALQRRNPAEAR